VTSKSIVVKFLKSISSAMELEFIKRL